MSKLKKMKKKELDKKIKKELNKSFQNTVKKYGIKRIYLAIKK